MQRTVQSIITFFCIILFLGCNSVKKQSWEYLIPGETTFVITPKTGVQVSNIGNTDYASILDDLTPGAIQQLGELPDSILSELSLKGLALYPASSTTSQFIWIAESTSDIDEVAPSFYEPFEQNYYSFNGLTVHKINFNETLMYASQIHQWVIFSESSLAVESALRTYLGLQKGMYFEQTPELGTLTLNTAELDRWVQQFINVGYRPQIIGSFDGFSPSKLTFTTEENISSGFELRGVIPAIDSSKSALVKSLSTINTPIILDRYIAGNAAAFSLHRNRPMLVPDRTTVSEFKLDSLLFSDPKLYRELALSLETEFGIVAFPESGLLTDGEYLYLRNLENSVLLRSRLQQFADEGLVIQQGNSFYVKSKLLSALISGNMSLFTDFYLAFSQDVVVMAKRRGLAESVDADRTRRRTVYYDDTFRSAKNEYPEGVSGFAWVNSDDFLKFLDPLMMRGTPLNGLIGVYDVLTMGFTQNINKSVNFTIKSVIEEGSTQPYDELWVLPLLSEELTGQPVLGNIVGNRSDEIIFSTTTGRIEAVAFDGTSVMQAQTNDGDVPIGSPVLYDWYGNGQPVILQAAGSKVYAWNESGRALPQFPIEIGEQISAPIVVSDVSRNGIPEIIVPTENRKIHVVDGRGQNLRGWPQFTSAVTRHAPLHTQVDGEWSVWVVSQNILHSWQRSGAVRAGYPTFINAAFNTTPTIFEDKILGAGSDGYVYAIGQNPGFADSLSISVQMDSIAIKSLYATSSQLNKITVEENILLRDSSGFYRSDLYLAQSVNGSILMFNPAGKLEITHNLGQPSSATMAPQILDINGDNRDEVIALADFGRLFAWEILTGRRIFSIPTSGMEYPIIADLNKDGLYELIAQTREGLRCWMINKAENN
jgi:hypothetical protein